jgi:hypothetical protein
MSLAAESMSLLVSFVARLVTGRSSSASSTTSGCRQCAGCAGEGRFEGPLS